jgi:hypothetical protein
MINEQGDENKPYAILLLDSPVSINSETHSEGLSQATKELVERQGLSNVPLGRTSTKFSNEQACLVYYTKNHFDNNAGVFKTFNFNMLEYLFKGFVAKII